MRTAAAGLPLVLALGLIFGLQGAVGDPHCNRGHPQLCVPTYSSTSTSTTIPKVVGVTVDGSQFPLLWAVTSPEGSVATTFQWQQGNSSGANFTNLAGETRSTYTVAAGDTGHSYRVIADGVTSAPYGVSTVSGVLYADHNPNASADLTAGPVPWEHIQTGTPASTVQNYDIGVRAGGYPDVSVNGITVAGGYSSTVAVAADPLALEGQVYELTTTTNAQYTGGSGSQYDRCDLWRENPAKKSDGSAMFTEGTETWEHFRIMVPSSWPAAATLSGGWTNTYQHHTSISVGSNAASGNALNLRNTATPEWWFNVTGGPAGTGNIYDGAGATGMITQRVASGITYDHWYDILMHIVWSTSNATGFAQYYLDGTLLTPTNTDVKQGASFWDSTRQGWAHATLATLSGSTDQPNYEFSNYHTHITSNASLYYGRLRIGTTRTIVGG